MKRWEANLRAYQGISAPRSAGGRRQKQRFEESDWMDSGPAVEVENSKIIAGPMPPPPSPTVKSLATLMPH